MQRRIVVTLFMISIFLLVTTRVASAQKQPPSSPADGSWTGEVSGAITNGTPGGSVPGGLDLMLHAWDETDAQKLMLHGQSTPEGRFVFDEVPFETGLVYAVMAVYEDGMYYSDLAQVAPDQTELQLEVPIYESTTDLSQARIDQVHVLFYFDQGGLAVSEVYVLSNLGDTTVKGADTLEDGTPVTLKFRLPEEAASISFSRDNGGRFLQYPGGFADTSPLVPGEGASQVLVSYVLPYEDGLVYSFSAPLETGSLSFLAPQDSGLTLEGEGIEASGEWPMQDGTNFTVFSHAAIRPGETIRLTLSGQPETGTAASDSLVSRNIGPGIGIGGLALGLALIFLGVWWWRKPESQPEETPVRDFQQILTEIAVLDETYERGEIEQAEYAVQRADLRQQAKATAQQDKDLP